MLCIRYELATFFTVWTQVVIFIFLSVRRVCVTATNHGQRKHSEFRVYALLVPKARLVRGWRSYSVYINTWKNTQFF